MSDTSEPAGVVAATTSFVHHYVHIDPVEISLDPLDITIRRPRPEGAAVTAILTIGGRLMPAQLSIDDTNETIQVFFVDDKGDTDAAAPDGAQVSFGVDDTNVATADPVSGKLTLLAEGSANGTASITDASGNPLLEPDGVTPFAVQPAPFTVVAGPAVGAGLKIAPATS